MSTKIFLSSRFEEFKELRCKIVKELETISELGIEIINLDDNTSDVRPALARSLDNIKESDYMIFLLGETYGEIQEKTGKSYIYSEFDKASSRTTKTKVLAYLIGNSYIEDQFSDDPIFRKFQEKILKNNVCSRIGSDYSPEEVAIKIKDDFLKALKDELNANNTEINKNTDKSNIEHPITENRLQKNFYMTDDILSAVFVNRRKLFEEKTRGVYYEYWEVKAPFPGYFLIFFPKSSIKKSAQNFINKLEINNIPLPKQLVILKEKEKTISTTFEELYKKNIDLDINSYSEFYWKNCVDDNFKMQKSTIVTEPNYIDQDFYSFDKNKKLGSSMDTVKKFINEESVSPIMAIMAQAGVGKTTFLEYLTKSINNSPNKHCVLISSVDLKDHYSNINSDKLPEIYSIYDFYSIYSKMDNIQNEHHLDRNIFNIGLFNGNIIIIIDGLDEIITLFQEKFHIDDFIDSLVELNNQLGKCKTIISSREYYWSQNTKINDDNIIIYRLQGFTVDLLNKYLDKRYSGDKNKSKYINKIKKYLSEIEDIAENKKYVPFVVDLICEMTEENLEENLEESDNNNLMYPNNNETIDKVIYGILKRETIRQTFHGTNVIELINMYIDFATEYSEFISKEEFEEYIQLRYPNTYSEVIKSLEFSPLLKFNDDNITFKYDILKNYFSCLALIRLFSDEKDYPILFNHLSKLYKSESPIFKDIKKFFHNNKQDLFLKNASMIVSKLVREHEDSNTTDIKKIQIEHSVSAILYLLISINNEQISADKKMDLILELYRSNNISSLFIFGDFYELDFSNITVRDSKFDGFTKFLTSKFNKSEFYYTQIKNIKGSIQAENQPYFDDSCELFELSGQIKNNEQLNYEDELRTILKKIYNKGSATRISIKKTDSLDINLMECLTELDIVKVTDETQSYVHYFLEDKKMIEVKQFLQNGKIGKNLRRVIKCIRKK